MLVYYMFSLKTTVKLCVCVQKNNIYAETFFSVETFVFTFPRTTCENNSFSRALFGEEYIMGLFLISNYNGLCTVECNLSGVWV